MTKKEIKQYAKEHKCSIREAQRQLGVEPTGKLKSSYNHKASVVGNTMKDQIIISDFTTALIEDPSKEEYLMSVCENLGQAERFTIVMPERFTDFITCEYSVRGDIVGPTVGNKYKDSVVVSSKNFDLEEEVA